MYENLAVQNTVSKAKLYVLLTYLLKTAKKSIFDFTGAPCRYF